MYKYIYFESHVPFVPAIDIMICISNMHSTIDILREACSICTDKMCFENHVFYETITYILRCVSPMYQQ